MKTCSKCKIQKNITDFYKCSHEKDGLNRWCKICFNAHLKNKKEAKSQYDKARYQEKHGQIKQYNLNWKKRNKNKILEYNRFYSSLRNAHVRMATPKLLSEEHKKQIVDFYANRPDGYHVDHIMPLRHKNMCGLHVPWNLQYLPAIENLKKGNR